MKAIVTVRGLSKVHGSGATQVHALSNIDLTLYGGQLTILMGPSGSGKTTLLSILGCMLKPTSGLVEIHGQRFDTADAEALAEVRRRFIGFVFQQFHLFPTLSAIENVKVALELQGARGKAATQKSRNALLRVGLERKIYSRPRELSGGEQQRVAIARALVSDPVVILADEPTAALDSEQGQNILKILSDLAADEHRTVLVVSHDNRITPFADRVVFIEDGRIVQQPKTSQGKMQRLQVVRRWSDSRP